MAQRTYLTVAEELLEHADSVADWFETHGYSVKAEPADAAYPYTPTLRCRRPPTTTFVEVTGKLSFERADSWARYGRSCTSDTRVVLAVPDTVERRNEDDARLQTMGVGLVVTGSDGPREALPAQDLAINVQLPEISSLPRKLRRLLGPVYEEFSRSHWREGFDDACQVLQVESAKYLANAIADGRVTVVSAGGRPRRLTAARIDRMTLGDLASAFQSIQTPNHPDTVIASVLNRVNRDRVGVAHHKKRRLTEARLRRNVGQHMWRIISALKAVHGIT